MVRSLSSHLKRMEDGRLRRVLESIRDEEAVWVDEFGCLTFVRRLEGYRAELGACGLAVEDLLREIEDFVTAVGAVSFVDWDGLIHRLTGSVVVGGSDTVDGEVLLPFA